MGYVKHNTNLEVIRPQNGSPVRDSVDFGLLIGPQLADGYRSMMGKKGGITANGEQGESGWGCVSVDGGWLQLPAVPPEARIICSKDGKSKPASALHNESTSHLPSHRSAHSTWFSGPKKRHTATCVFSCLFLPGCSGEAARAPFSHWSARSQTSHPVFWGCPI